MTIWVHITRVRDGDVITLGARVASQDAADSLMGAIASALDEYTPGQFVVTGTLPENHHSKGS